METPQQPPHSQLFLVRLWVHAGDGAGPAWGGKVQHVVSGEAHYFQDWPGLIALLQASLPDGALPDPLAPADRIADPI